MSRLELPDALVDIDWLKQHLHHDKLVIFDASWHLPTSGRDGAKEWLTKRIPGARFFDFDRKICQPQSELPHMMPDEALFTREVQALGLKQKDVVVISDVRFPDEMEMIRKKGGIIIRIKGNHEPENPEEKPKG